MNIKNSINNFKEEEKGLYKYFFSFYFWASLLFAAIFTFIIYFNYQPQKKLDYKIGDIANSNIKAPLSFKIINKEATEKMKKEELKKVPFVYDYISEAKKTSIERLNRLFKYFYNYNKYKQRIKDEFGLEIGKADYKTIYNRKKLKEINNIIKSILDELYNKDILLDKEKLIQEGKAEAILNKNGKRSSTLINNIWGNKNVREFIETYLKNKNGFIANSGKLIENIFFAVFVPMYDKNESESRQLKILTEKNLTPVYNLIKKGRMIVRNGDEIDQKTFNIILELKKHQQINKKPFSLIFATFLFIFIILSIAGIVIKTFDLKYITNKKIFNIILLNLLLSLIIYKLYLILSMITANNGSNISIISQKAIHFLIPSQAGSIILAFLINFNIAIIFIILMTIITGLFLIKDYYLLLFLFITATIPALKLKYSRQNRRSEPIKIALYILLPISVILILFYHLLFPQQTASSNFFNELFAAVIGAITTAVIISALIPIEESAFDIISNLKLLELSNLDLPIFREMALKAPGSYQHSLMVASLAEQAANDIGLNAALVRCQALYHDIGKIARPEYFIENQNNKEGGNIHNTLQPETSVIYIKNHISDGIVIAKKLGLPQQIIDGIKQHHGTSLIKYFYNKALDIHKNKKQTNGEKENGENNKNENGDEIKTEIDEKLFRYAGPKPQTKETAVLMLADAVEASSKSLTHIEEGTFKILLKKIFSNIIEDGQLDESGISLKDLVIISDSFLNVLKNIYHGRISYPGFDFNEKEENGDKPDNKD
jgi:putative nucleotidyltransferase with HDIG domain